MALERDVSGLHMNRRHYVSVSAALAAKAMRQAMGLGVGPMAEPSLAGPKPTIGMLVKSYWLNHHLVRVFLY